MRFTVRSNELRIGPLVVWVRRCGHCHGLLWNATDMDAYHEGACREAHMARLTAQVAEAAR